MAVRASKPRPQPFSGPYPVHIHYHFKLAGSRLDIDNHSYMGKLCLDALVAVGVLPGDEQKYVSGITITAEKIAKEHDNEVDVVIHSA